jgi:membrane dipeptidase
MPRVVPLLLLALTAWSQTKVDPSRVTRLLNRAIVVDLHDDTTQMILDEAYKLDARHDYGQVDIPRMRQGGVTGLFLSIWTDSDRYTPTEAIRRTLEQIDAVRREVARNSSNLDMAATADQIATAKQRGRIAMLMGVEGGHTIDSDLAILRAYYDLGVRYMTLTHTNNTPWADSSGHKPEHNGLTNFGKEVVREMNRLGMMVDISHVSDKTFYDALEASSAPLIASHSSCRALAPAARNMTDDMLRALAKKEGVVHINFYEGFLDADFETRLKGLKQEEAEAAALEKRAPKFGDRTWLGPESRKVDARRNAKLGRIPLSRLLDHFQHAIQVAGVDHVGLGSDFDGANDEFPAGMEDISKIPNLVAGLMERGLSDDDILKILGGNTLRVMREVEAAATRQKH